MRPVAEVALVGAGPYAAAVLGCERVDTANPVTEAEPTLEPWRVGTDAVATVSTTTASSLNSLSAAPSAEQPAVWQLHPPALLDAVLDAVLKVAAVGLSCLRRLLSPRSPRRRASRRRTRAPSSEPDEPAPALGRLRLRALALRLRGRRR